MTRSVLAAALAFLLQVAVAQPTASARPHDAVIGRSFASYCAFSHRAPDDPIVSPGHPGDSHDHTFVGNTSTNAESTLTSLRKARTTCQPLADTAAYWAPTLEDDESPVQPLGATIYYRRLTFAPVRAFPPGLRMIAGDSSATRPQAPRITYWRCSLAKTDFNYDTGVLREPQGAHAGIPSCGRRSNLELVVDFPGCWNGRTLDSPTHKDHVAYSRAGRCPSGYPVPIPALSLVYRYPPLRANGLFLSSGGQFSGHADFINAWNEAALVALVDGCLNAAAYCPAG